MLKKRTPIPELTQDLCSNTKTRWAEIKNCHRLFADVDQNIWGKVSSYISKLVLEEYILPVALLLYILLQKVIAQEHIIIIHKTKLSCTNLLFVLCLFRLMDFAPTCFLPSRRWCQTGFNLKKIPTKWWLSTQKHVVNTKMCLHICFIISNFT